MAHEININEILENIEEIVDTSDDEELFLPAALAYPDAIYYAGMQKYIYFAQ